MFEMTLLLFGTETNKFCPNRSVRLNIFAIVVSVGFLVFVLSIFDSYKEKVDRIVFSLTPHIAIRSIASNKTQESEAIEEDVLCRKICSKPFAVDFTGVNNIKSPGRSLTNEQIRFIDNTLEKVLPEDASVNWILFDGVSLQVGMSNDRLSEPQFYHILGVRRVKGDQFAPQIDLAQEEASSDLRFTANKGVLIATSLAKELQAKSALEIVPGRTTLALSGAKSRLQVTISGLHQLGIHSISHHLLIAPYEIAQELLSSAVNPSYIGITLQKPKEADKIAASLRMKLRIKDITALSWIELSDLYDQLELYRQIIFITLSLSVLITGLHTFTNINILIMQRIKAIGILKTIGIKSRNLYGIFMVIGIMQSILGTTFGYFIGAVCGFALNDHINRLIQHDISIGGTTLKTKPETFLIILLFVTIVSISSCLFASRHAIIAKISDNLRSE